MDWKSLGLCRKVSGIDFFPDPKTGPGASKAAKAVCSACFVRAQCLDEALRHDEVGIWGGTTERERKLIKDKYVRVKGIKPLARTISGV